MKRIPKDPVREMVVKNMPPAPPGMKKVYNPDTRTVDYKMKTPKEQLRERR